MSEISFVILRAPGYGKVRIAHFDPARALVPSMDLFSALIVASMALAPAPCIISRRAVLLGAPAAAWLVAPRATEASYAMTQAAQSQQKWEATGIDKERAAYASIQAALEEKRPYREEAGELGYVGGSYTKKSAADRLEFDEKQKKAAASSGGSYMRAEDLVLLSTQARRSIIAP